VNPHCRGRRRDAIAPRLVSGAKKFICHSNAPTAASSIAITDWQY
jgi:hypothetical protein